MRFKAGKKAKLFLTILTALLALGWWFIRQTPEFVIADLANPTELRALGERGANSRLNEIVFQLHEAERNGRNLTNVLGVALWSVYRNEAQRDLVQGSLLRNLAIAQRLGLLAGEHQNLEQLHRGRSPTITTGPYAGEKTEVDHIVPRSLAPETDNELGNLELMPASLNRKKSNHVSSRQITHAELLFKAGLLTAESLERVRAQVRTGDN
ncbi:MAG: HNH endonuclease domain-containing protein [Verrucomicrobiota bacterium]